MGRGRITEMIQAQLINVCSLDTAVFSLLGSLSLGLLLAFTHLVNKSKSHYGLSCSVLAGGSRGRQHSDMFHSCSSALASIMSCSSHIGM